MAMSQQTPRRSPLKQTAIIQCTTTSASTSSSLEISHSAPVPTLDPRSSPHHVLVRVLAVALNPTDYKMILHFPKPGNFVGCDFCGVVEDAGSECALKFPPGTRVAGAVFPYNPSVDSTNGNCISSGAFAQWLITDSRLLLKVPETWDDLQGAALGGVGWGTAGLALCDPEALNLSGRPSTPSTKNEPVVVFGGATASGTMACQVLQLSGYSPIAVTSTASAALAISYGAVNTIAYTLPAPTCIEKIKSVAGQPIRHVLDCITSADSAAICFSTIARTGGRYACLEGLPAAWRTRRAIQVKEVMGFEGLGARIDLGDTPYSREANPELAAVCASWTAEMQWALDAAKIRCHPIREVPGQWEGILEGLELLQRGDIRGQKLVVRIAMK